MEANHPWESAPAVMGDYRDRQRNYWEKCELIDKSVWIPCPNCKQRTKTKVYEDTVLLNCPLSYPKCKKKTRVNVVKLKMTISNEPDAKAQSLLPNV